MKPYRIWAVCLTVAAGSTLALAADKGDAAKGKEVFAARCAMCHSADTDERKQGPGLKGLMKKDKMANGKKITEASIRTQIDDGDPAKGMPPYKDTLEAPEKDNLIAYLKTL